MDEILKAIEGQRWYRKIHAVKKILLPQNLPSEIIEWSGGKK